MAKTIEITKQAVVVGRDKKIIDPDVVYTYAKCGTPYSKIARFLGITESSLKYNFRDELDRGTADLDQSLRMAQIEIALDKNHKNCGTMLIWLGKNILGQSDVQHVDINEAPLPWNADDEDYNVDFDDDYEDPEDDE